MSNREIPCVWFEPTDLASVRLRRYSRLGVACKGPRGYHNADVDTGQIISFPVSNGYTGASPLPSEASKLDSGWPTRCQSCEYNFEPADDWRIHHDRLFRDVASGALVPFQQLPRGALWDGSWYFHDPEDPKPGPDGYVLYVNTPAGIWCIDGPQSDGTGGWKRTGVVPKISVTPSINFVGSWHGWLTDGVLKEC